MKPSDYSKLMVIGSNVYSSVGLHTSIVDVTETPDANVIDEAEKIKSLLSKQSLESIIITPTEAKRLIIKLQSFANFSNSYFNSRSILIFITDSIKSIILSTSTLSLSLKNIW